MLRDNWLEYLSVLLAQGVHYLASKRATRRIAMGGTCLSEQPSRVTLRALFKITAFFLARRGKLRLAGRGSREFNP